MAIEKLTDMINEMKGDEKALRAMPGLVGMLERTKGSLPADADEKTVDCAIKDCLRAYTRSVMEGSAGLSRDSRPELILDIDSDDEDDEDDDFREFEEFEKKIRENSERRAGMLANMHHEFLRRRREREQGELLRRLRRADHEKIEPDLPDPDRLPDNEETARRLKDILELRDRGRAQRANALADIIEEHFIDNDLLCRRFDGARDSQIFDLNFVIDTCYVAMKMIVSAHPDLLSFDLTLPIGPDPQYISPLCREICRINEHVPIGAFVYSRERKGVILRYCYPVEGELAGDAIRAIINNMLKECDDHFLPLSRLAAGAAGPRDDGDIFDIPDISDGEELL